MYCFSSLSRVTLSVFLVGVAYLGGCQKSEKKSKEKSEEMSEEKDTNAAGVFVTGQVALKTGTMPDTAIAFPVSGGTFADSNLATVEAVAITSGQLALEIEGQTSSLALNCAPENTMCNQGGGEGGGSADSHVIVLFNESPDRFTAGESFRYVNLDTGNDTDAVNITIRGRPPG